ncbi:calcium/sodium antiporter [Halohasta litorea]|uniref:Calcium/sodium antiporter n=1 Tax=Halohasta litorea TaxID=869891 RepID=A0ABD6D6Q1_9EURY|nr:calcium/sodium antiporter [Halohasta litorea]
MTALAVSLDIVAVLLAVVSLWYGSRSLVEGAVQIARRLGLSELVIGLTIVAAGTSMPEFVVTSDAALAGLGDIAVGNIVGSNIYNLAVVLGVVALFQRIPVDRAIVRRDGAVLFVTTVVALVFISDLTITRIEGGVLFAGLLAYLLVLARSSDATNVPSELTAAESPPLWREIAHIIGGLVLVIAGGHLLVTAASDLALFFGVPSWAIGATVVAAGTSTPELAVSLIAIRRGRIGVSLGNVLGSNALNILGALGIAALLRPLDVTPAAIDDTLWLLALSSGVLLLLWTGRSLSRLEGGLMMLTELIRWIGEFLLR